MKKRYLVYNVLAVELKVTRERKVPFGVDEASGGATGAGFVVNWPVPTLKKRWRS